MNLQRIALANLVIARSPEESVAAAERAIVDAGAARARIVCFPECFVPGYRGLGYKVPPPDAEFLERAWPQLADRAKQAAVTVILGTERIVDGALLAAALVLNADGTRAGFQDKVQVDPSEDGTYAAACPGRHIFRAAPIAFGITICHEGWRYPETVRWPALHGAHVVFHPHFSVAEPGGYVPSTFGDPANTFHEKAALCRAAENTIYFATVNCASAGSPTTSAVVNPDGTLLCYQPYGKEGLLVAELDLDAATGLLARRWKAT
jgi:predicted amidohydrolase